MQHIYILETATSPTNHCVDNKWTIALTVESHDYSNRPHRFQYHPLLLWWLLASIAAPSIAQQDHAVKVLSQPHHTVEWNSFVGEEHPIAPGDSKLLLNILPLPTSRASGESARPTTWLLHKPEIPPSPPETAGWWCVSKELSGRAEYLVCLTEVLLVTEEERWPLSSLHAACGSPLSCCLVLRRWLVSARRVGYWISHVAQRYADIGARIAMAMDEAQRDS